MSVFEKYRPQAWPHVFDVTLNVGQLVGGVPTDPKVAEGWIRSKTSVKDTEIQAAVLEVMTERGVSKDEAIEIVNLNKHLNGFKRDEKGLYIEGRQIKAMIKEAASVAAAAKKLPLKSWGETRKGLLGFVAEHICVVEDRVPIFQHNSTERVLEPSGVNQKFVHTWQGNGIQYEEYVLNADVHFTVMSDYDFDAKHWAMLWLTGEQQGLGASRSQGYGKYEVTRWDKRKMS